MMNFEGRCKFKLSAARAGEPIIENTNAHSKKSIETKKQHYLRFGLSIGRRGKASSALGVWSANIHRPNCALPAAFTFTLHLSLSRDSRHLIRRIGSSRVGQFGVAIAARVVGVAFVQLLHGE